MADDRIAYGARCTWWDHISKVGTWSPKPRAGEAPHTLPCCPHCRGMLFECANEDVFMDGVRKFEAKGHEGYTDFMLWVRGKCFAGVDSAASMYRIETGKAFELKQEEKKES